YCSREVGGSSQSRLAHVDAGEVMAKVLLERGAAHPWGVGRTCMLVLVISLTTPSCTCPAPLRNRSGPGDAPADARGRLWRGGPAHPVRGVAGRWSAPGRPARGVSARRVRGCAGPRALYG